MTNFKPGDQVIHTARAGEGGSSFDSSAVMVTIASQMGSFFHEKP